MSTETVQTAVKDVVQDAVSIVKSDAGVQKVVGDVLVGDLKDVVPDLKKVDVKKIATEVLADAKAEVTSHTVSFTCCCVPWSLQISHTPTASSQPTPAASS